MKPFKELSSPARERGFLLIADMESSTQCKYLLNEVQAFNAMRQHNHLVIDHCQSAAPVHGLILNSLGDAVVAKFPYLDDPRDALASCIRAAQQIVSAFESVDPIKTPKGREFHVRSKLLLQSYDAFSYGRRDEGAQLAEELVGADIDLAFRLASVAWRLQVLVTEAFLVDLIAHSNESQIKPRDPQAIMEEAHIARHRGALSGEPLIGISEALRFDDLDYWVTDARDIARMKGIAKTRQVFSLAFESPESLIARNELQRLTIKVRQDRHAVILASISLGKNLNDNYIEHVVEKLRDSTSGSRLDSEITLFAAAKVYGEFDFFFRVSCIDDVSLRRFFDAIRADSFGVSHIEVRSTITDRLAATRHYDRIFRRFNGKPYEIVLTWFERIPSRDIFAELKSILEREDAGSHPVELLEVGEVIHHAPVYAIFFCDTLRDYAAFFEEHRLSPTGCHSHVGHIDRPADAQLRYSLVNSVYLPRLLSND